MDPSSRHDALSAAKLLSGDLGLISLLGLVGLLSTLRGLLLGLDGLVHLDLEAKFLGSGLHRQGDTTTLGVDLHDLDLDVLAGLDNLSRGVDVTTSHLGDMHETLDGVAKFDERTERNDLGDLAVDDGSDRVGLDELNPRILGGLLETERDALTLQIDVENLDLDLVADLDDLGGMVDMVPGKLGDVNQTVDAAQVHEGARSPRWRKRCP